MKIEDSQNERFAAWSLAEGNAAFMKTTLVVRGECRAGLAQSPALRTRGRAYAGRPADNAAFAPTHRWVPHNRSWRACGSCERPRCSRGFGAGFRLVPGSAAARPVPGSQD